MSTIPKTETPDLITLMEHWAKTIAKNGGVAAVTIQEGADRLRELQARAEKAEASLHDLNLDLSTANHMIKLERDRADTLQTRLNEIHAMLNSPETF
jgi:predicted nuclease with TOPRIM domain